MSGFEGLSRRAAGAFVGILVLLALVLPDWPGSFPLVAAACAVAALAAGEGIRLSGGQVRLGGALVMAATAGATLAIARGLMVALPLLVLPGLLAGFLLVIRGDPAGSLRTVAGAGWIAALAATGLGLLARIRIEWPGPWFLFIPLLICWFGDSAAYFAGSAIGRRRMCPATSPSKTWEGFAAGLAGSALGAIVAGSLGAGQPLWSMALLGVLGGAAGALGDLVESALKRDAGVKDSGTFIPGHGGVLDRMDSLVVAAPVVWLWLRLLGSR
jgi:phosphatidate cytidylyltransferase